MRPDDRGLCELLCDPTTTEGEARREWSALTAFARPSYRAGHDTAAVRTTRPDLRIVANSRGAGLGRHWFKSSSAHPPTPAPA
jgi:hypothetical protein